MLCLDSTFIVDFLRNKPKAKQKFEETEKNLIFTTIINLFEVMSGVYAAKDKYYEKHINALNEFLKNIPIFELDLASIEKASQINGELSLSGQKIDDLDVLIAGIILSNSYNTILTENTKHFSRIKGLKVETY